MKQTAASQKNTPISVLIADDDRLILSTMQSGLVDAGFEVGKVENGNDALDYCLKYQPNLAILDIEMPDMSGLRVAEQLVSQTSIPFMFLTAYDTNANVNTAKDMGAIGFMVKPLAINQMIPEIQIALERDAETKQLLKSETGLKASLEKSKHINMVVGVIMERYRLTSQEAFEQIRNLARSERKTLLDVATEITSAESILIKFRPKH